MIGVLRRALARRLAVPALTTSLQRIAYSVADPPPSSRYAAVAEYLSGLYAKSVENPTEFWLKRSEDIAWIRPPVPAEVLSTDPDTGLARWFQGALVNTSALCLDEHIARGRGDFPALIYDSPVCDTKETITFSALREDVAGYAGALQSLGVGKGDRVIIYCPMIPGAIKMMLACARIGAIHSVVFGGFAPAELASRVVDCKPKVIVTAPYGIEVDREIPYKPIVDEALDLAAEDSGFSPECGVVMLERSGCRTFASAQPSMIPGRDKWLPDLLKDSTPCNEPVPLCATDPLYILYTSGTTGKPKGVVRTHGGHAVALKWTMRHVFDMGPGDVMFTASDIGWVVGHSYMVYAPLLAGSATIVYEGKPVRTPDPSSFWRVLAEHKVKAMFTAPTAFRAIIKEDPESSYFQKYKDRLGQLKTVVLAGERCDPTTLQWLQKLLPDKHILDQWWQTETGFAICANPTHTAHHSDLPNAPVKVGSTGLPMPGYDVRALDDSGNPVKAGEQGHLVIKLPLPPSCFTTLWNNPDRTIDAYLKEFPGYYNTGDAGLIDSDGYVHVMGRLDDVMNVAGHRLSSGDIEEAVSFHRNVAECAVVAVDDDFKGQMPVAFVVPKGNNIGSGERMAAEIKLMVRERIGGIASLKEVIFVDRLPRTRSGKILRKAMRAIANVGILQPVPSTIETPAVLDEVRTALDAAVIGKFAEEQATKRAVDCLKPPLSKGFRAIRVLKHPRSSDEKAEVAYDQQIRLQELPAPDPRANVTVKVEYSNLNYKDGMVLTGMKGVATTLPLVPGIDFAGTVLEAGPSSGFEEGDKVVLTGHYAGQHCDGGFSEVVRVRGSWLVKLSGKDGLKLSTWESMAIGTAGFTAMQCIDILERLGGLVRGEDQSPILCTGAGGGVGSVAVALLSRLGYRVHASTGRVTELRNYMHELGAERVIGRLTLNSSRPLEGEKWGGVVDSVGASTLAAALASTQYGRAVASCGVAGGAEIPTTVYPFILRGVRLLGVDSVQLPMAERLRIWSLVDSLFPQEFYSKVAHTVDLEDVPHIANDIIKGRTQGRVVIKVSKD